MVRIDDDAEGAFRCTESVTSLAVADCGRSSLLCSGFCRRFPTLELTVSDTLMSLRHARSVTTCGRLPQHGAIARLEQLGWIDPLPVEERRRPYRITKQGVRVLHAKLSILRQLSTAGIRRLEAI